MRKSARLVRGVSFLCQFCAIYLQKRAIIRDIPQYANPVILLNILTLFIVGYPCIPTTHDF